MKKYFKLAIDNLKVVIRRFPIVLATSAAAGVFAILLIHETYDDFETPSKVLMCLVMFALTSLIAKIAYERYEKIKKLQYSLILGAGAILASCFGLFLLDYDLQYPIIRYATVIFALIILVFALPFLSKYRGSSSFTNRIGWRIAITTLYTGVLIGGLCALLFAIEELLNVNLIDEIYGDTAMVVLSIFSPMFLLTGIDYEKYTPSKLYKVLIVYILMPLLLAYTSVVYAYIIRIMFNSFEMPGGIVGNLVLWYGFVGIWVIFLSKEYLTTGFGKFFNRFYPIASVIPIITMFIALYIRINQYGFTENRYFSLVGGIWIFLMTIFYIFTSLEKRRHVVMLVSLVIISALTIIGPLSAGAVSLRSQSNRLENLLIEENILVKDKIVDTDDISQQAMNIIRYIDRNHGFDKVDFLNEKQVEELKDNNIEYREIESEYKYNREFEDTFDISGYDLMKNIYDYENDTDINDQLYFEQENGVLYFYLHDEQNLIIDLNKHYQALEDKGDILGDDYDDFIVINENDNMKVKLVFQSIHFESKDVVEVDSYNGMLLIKIK